MKPVSLEPERGRRTTKRIIGSLVICLSVCLSAVLLIAFPTLLRLVVQFASFDTEYAVNYSESGFAQVQFGDTKEEVLRTLGQPLARVRRAAFECWVFQDELSGTALQVWFLEDGAVADGWGNDLLPDSMLQLLAQLRRTRSGPQEVEAVLGLPTAKYRSHEVEWWLYTRSPSSSNYHQRSIGFDSRGNVMCIRKQVYWD